MPVGRDGEAVASYGHLSSIRSRVVSCVSDRMSRMYRSAHDQYGRSGNDPGRARVSDSVENIPSAGLVTVYWRPGCPYCALLRRALRRAGLETTEVNIWQEEAAADAVRSIAHGNETVPTVVVGETQLVNPSARMVLDTVRAEAPQLLADAGLHRQGRLSSTLAIMQWVVIAVLIATSFAVEAGGHEAASWAVDGINLAWFFGIRAVRRRLRPVTSR